MWDNLFDIDIEQLGSIKLNDQMNISPTRTFSTQMKSVVPDYKTKQLPTAYRCKKSSDKKSSRRTELAQMYVNTLQNWEYLHSGYE